MQFHTYIFIFAFFPVCVLGYFLLNRWKPRAGKHWLLLSSTVFFLYGGWKSAFWLLLSILFNCSAACLLMRTQKKRRAVFCTAIAVNVLLLVWFKCRGFFASDSFVPILSKTEKELVLPLAISFYTFQQIAFLCDVYRRESETYSLEDYLLYILFFPKLLMGPITEPENLIPQFHDSSRLHANSGNIASGLRLFAIGLAKKAVLADSFAVAAPWLISNLQAASSLDALICTLAYTFEIYFDFSGYSDMAIGIARSLNFELPMNFDSPYKAVSIGDFWKRWHVSLTAFLTRHIYIPLGGNRKGTARTCLNIMIVFLVSGAWHGSGLVFLIWGAVHGILSVLERLGKNLIVIIPKPVRWLMTFTSVSLLWIAFYAESSAQWLEIIIRIFRFDGLPVSMELYDLFAFPETGLIKDLLYVCSVKELSNVIWPVLYLSLGFFLCLIPQNSCRTADRLTPSGAVFSAVALVFGIIHLAGETVFIYSGF